MRNLFLALVLANLGFAAWHYAQPDPAGGRVERGGEGAGIPLVSELSQPPGAAEVATPASSRQAGESGPDVAAARDAPETSGAGADEAPADAVPAAEPETLRCRSIGPFEELSQVAVAASTLRADGFEPSQRVAEGEVWAGFWVYMEDVPGGERARAILSDLEAGGVPEAYLISDSDSDGNLISLGVFSEAARAERFAARVRDLGYEPIISERTRRATVYWVDVLIAGEATIDLERLQPAGRIVRLEERACP